MKKSFGNARPQYHGNDAFNMGLTFKEGNLSVYNVILIKVGLGFAQHNHRQRMDTSIDPGIKLLYAMNFRTEADKIEADLPTETVMLEPDWQEVPAACSCRSQSSRDQLVSAYYRPPARNIGN